MRIFAFLCSAWALTAITGHEAAVSDQRVTIFLQTTQRIVQHASYPVLFVGRIVERDSGRLPCTAPSGQSITYSVETVLFGFAPPDRVKVAYPKCGRFSSQDELLVLAVPSGKDSWASQKELMVPAIPANLQKAQTLLNVDLKNRISEFMRYHGPHQYERVVVFEGTVRDPITDWEKPIDCLKQACSPMNYDVEQVLYGDWTEKQIVVNIGICGYLPGLPILAGRRMIVFAAVPQKQSRGYGSLDALFAPEQMAQVKAAVGLQ
jgi:hypothetical protein